MFQRARGLDHNQENPYHHAGPSTSFHHHHKTPARSLPLGKQTAPVTGGKGALLTNTAARGVLGRKDGNLNGKDSALLFTSKPATSTSQVPTFKTPAPKPRSLRPLADLQTPATALRPKRAPLLVPSPQVEREVVEVDLEAQEQVRLRNMLDLDVEYAGPSATDYEEPYEPECQVTDYTKVEYGPLLRAMSFTGVESQHEWEARDSIARNQVEFTLDAEFHLDSTSDIEDDSEKPIFPLPARRNPLASKPSNRVQSKPIAPNSVRKPLHRAQTSSGARPPALKPSTTLQAGTLARRAPLSQSTLSLGRPGSLSTSTVSKSIRTDKKLLDSVAPVQRPLHTSLSQTRVRTQTPLSSSTVTRKPSNSSISSTSIQPPPRALFDQLENRKRRQQELKFEEEQLGAFGLVDHDEADQVLSRGFESNSGFRFQDEEEPTFELDLDL
ncbi:uncharacterized protein JCM15063_001033 [Sporobolomyces koalae]|uniref:uncharacterized protein n=1 Tax=Sporobolomyces koalae TaxID=500713 RepID=UPI003179B522